MHPLVIAALLQLFIAAMLVSQGGRRFWMGTYVPIGVALMGITFAALALAMPT